MVDRHRPSPLLLCENTWQGQATLCYARLTSPDDRSEQALDEIYKDLSSAVNGPANFCREAHPDGLVHG